MIDGDLPIGEVAAACGVPVSTVRYYSDIGLVPVSGRVGGKRRFSESAIARIRFIRLCRGVGFTPAEIDLILTEDAGRWHRIVEAKLSELAERKRHLDEAIDVLTDISGCGCARVEQCEVLNQC